MKKLKSIGTMITTLVEFVTLRAPKHVDFQLHLPRFVREAVAIVETSTRTFSTGTWTNGKSHDAPPPPQFT